jgi:CspA family cold shock protein
MVQDWLDGVVREYDERKGFGVIDSPNTPSGCWFHYPMIEVPGRKRPCSAGQLVHFSLECEAEQDGVVFRATKVPPLI